MQALHYLVQPSLVKQKRHMCISQAKPSSQIEVPITKPRHHLWQCIYNRDYLRGHNKRFWLSVQRARSFPKLRSRSDAHWIYFRFDGLQDLPIHFNIRAHLCQFLCTQILKSIGQPSSPSDLLRSQFSMLYILQSNNKDWERLVHLNFHKQDRLQKPLDSEYLLHSKGVYKNRNETNFIQLKVNNAYIKKLISPDL